MLETPVASFLFIFICYCLEKGYKIGVAFQMSGRPSSQKAWIRYCLPLTLQAGNSNFKAE